MKTLAIVAVLAFALTATVQAQPVPTLPIPQAVIIMDQDLAALIALYNQGNWDDAIALVDRVTANAPQVTWHMQANRLPPSSVNDFQFLIFRLQELNSDHNDPVRTALVANQIAYALIDVQRCYVSAVPLGLLRMRPLARDIGLLSQVVLDYGLQASRVRQLTDQWYAIRPMVLARGGLRLAVDMDTVIDNLGIKVSNEQMIHESERAGLLIDQMRQLFGAPALPNVR